MKKSDDIDSWFFKNLVKGIIDALIVLLNLLRPKDDKPKPSQPYQPKPNPLLPNKPWFPWLRRQIDTVISVNNIKDSNNINIKKKKNK
jgi:hypothetical protein